MSFWEKPRETRGNTGKMVMALFFFRVNEHRIVCCRNKFKAY